MGKAHKLVNKINKSVKATEKLIKITSQCLSHQVEFYLFNDIQTS